MSQNLHWNLQNLPTRFTLQKDILRKRLLIIWLLPEDLTRGSIVEKVNRETIAAAKYASLEILNHAKTKKKD